MEIVQVVQPASESGIFTVRSLAYVIAGHLIHHLALLRERYLQ
jgi:hypothetical protein